MKLIYCINAVSNSGGMERILMHKANYLADVMGYDVTIVTTEQGGCEPFFHFSPKIKFIDLDVDYGDRADKKKKNIVWKVFWKFLQKSKHKKRLNNLLNKEKADVVISLFNNDISFLSKIKDGSKKILEFHFSYSYKLIEANNPLVRLVQKLRLYVWKKNISQFDRFVVLTHEDKASWGGMDNIMVIPNFIPALPIEKSSCSSKRVIAVGRAEYQKGFDMLITAWKNVAAKFPEWSLDIFGNGEKKLLEYQISKLGLNTVVKLHPATKNIAIEYVNSSLFVLSSRYEGLPMVLLEAMSYGLPVVAFECPCGPKEIIEDSFGTLVPNGDINGLANSIVEWISNNEKCIEGGRSARIAIQKYTQDVIMKQWVYLLENN